MGECEAHRERQEGSHEKHGKKCGQLLGAKTEPCLTSGEETGTSASGRRGSEVGSHCSAWEGAGAGPGTGEAPHTSSLPSCQTRRMNRACSRGHLEGRRRPWLHYVLQTTLRNLVLVCVSVGLHFIIQMDSQSCDHFL